MATALIPHCNENNPLQLAVARTLIGGIEAALNAGDAHALASRFARGAVWTDAMGARLVGRDEIEAAGGASLGLPDAARRQLDIIQVTPIRSDVLAVNVLLRPEAGKAGSDTEAMALYVLARGEDGWSVVAGQDTILTDLQ
jgi:uncharacterized protein (TIGR02246 family)